MIPIERFHTFAHRENSIEKVSTTLSNPSRSTIWSEVFCSGAALTDFMHSVTALCSLWLSFSNPEFFVAAVAMILW